MEDIVTKAVNTLYDRVKSENVAWLTCDCENCRLDTVSYVLNRIPPKYIVSGRGVTHNAEYLASSQLQADIDSLALEGMRTVSSTKRPFHSEDRKDCEVQLIKGKDKPAYNFFTFMGNVLDGNTFEPVTEADITLKLDGKIAEMVDKTWSNPYHLVRSTKGVYSFWVKSLPAKKSGIREYFKFSIEIKAEGYSDSVYHFEVPIMSEDSVRQTLDSTYTLKIKDLVIFKK
jgi:competence protein ComFB